ncbi:MAG: phage tail protein [Bacteroidales bacterium]
MTEHLQINDVAPCVHYLADGVQTAFTFPFVVFKAADLEVWRERERVAAGFAVSGVGITGGGTVLFDVPPAAGCRVRLRRRMALARISDFQTDGIIRAKTLNDELDYQVAAVQQVADDVSRCLRRPFTSDSAADLSLPDPVPGRGLKWNADGSAMVNTDYDPDTAPAAQVAVTADRQAVAADRAVAEQAAAEAQLAAATAVAVASSVSTPLDRRRNLGDLEDVGAARVNLGLAAIAASGAYGDLTGTPALGSAAAASLGTGAGQVPTADQVPGLVQGVPTGSVLPYCSSTLPSGWLLCDGAAVSRTTYARLFGVLGTAFGAGDGSTTFNLPDLRGRTAIGAGTGSGLSARTLGGKVGAETHTLVFAEMPSHSHTYTAHTRADQCAALGGDVANTQSGIVSTATNYVGGSGAHNNMQPSLVLNFIVKT